jgi:hypothetical protein
MKLFAAALLAWATPAADAAPTPVSVAKHRAPDGSHGMTHEVVVEAPLHEVWYAIATPQGWTSWAVPVAWRPEGTTDVIETSYTPAARAGDSTTIRQRFFDRVHGRRLAFQTVKAPEGFPDFATFAKVVNVFELEMVAPERTRVRLTATGYADTESGRRLLRMFEAGNRVSLESLRDRFAHGPVDWPSKLARMRKGIEPQTEGK